MKFCAGVSVLILVLENLLNKDSPTSMVIVMVSPKLLFLVVVLLLFSSFVRADTAPCSQDSFRQACTSCPFDANGKMDQKCWEKYQQQGTSCIAKEYPVTSGMYSQGNCPEIDACANNLKVCVAAAPTLSDKEDCSSIPVMDCYWYADQCVKAAEHKCNPLNIQGCFPTVILLFSLVSVVACCSIYSSR